MNRTAWLQDRRMQEFRDVLSRWERKELSAFEAGETFPTLPAALRGGLAGLVDGRLGKESARRVPIDKIVRMLYRTHRLGCNVKHFHEHILKQHGSR
jgi:hypothetical protein